jgi:hypothetical protein
MSAKKGRLLRRRKYNINISGLYDTLMFSLLTAYPEGGCTDIG